MSTWRRPRTRVLALALLAIAVAGVALLVRPGGTPSSGSRTSGHPATGVSDPSVRRRVLLGHSVEGRPIYALELGDPDNGSPTLTVGVVHGNETGGLAVTRNLAHDPPPKEALVWIVGKLNPDGVAAGTRQNADQVDLNRNFPYRWRPIGAPGDLQYSGPRPLSEPEARIAHSLILRVRPRITVWFHQPLGLVDESGGDLGVERRFARLVGLPLHRLTRYPGSAAGWQNHRLPHTTAFVVELPPGTPPAKRADRYADALLRLAS